MTKRFWLLCLSLLLVGCFAKKKTTYAKPRKVHVAGDGVATAGHPESSTTRDLNRTEADLIVDSALAYSGTRYRYGGTTKKGMDCSGLVYVAFQENGEQLPRVSRDMAQEGRKIGLNKVEKGDLLFFATQGSRINHVGLVVSVRGKDIRFIHSTSSRGVIVSSIREGYWSRAFVKAKKVL